MANRRQVKKLQSKQVGFGEQAERLFISYLLNKFKHRIITKNFYYQIGEIDVISFKDEVIYFWEIKARHSLEFGYPEEAVTPKKVAKIERGMEIFFRHFPRFKKYDYQLKIASLIFNFQNQLEDMKIFEII